MTRIPIVAPQDLREDQRPLHEQLTKLCEQHFEGILIWRRPDGALIGPMAIYLYMPSIGQAFCTLLASLMSAPYISPSARETAIMALGRKSHAKYMSYSHEVPAEALAKTAATASATTKGEGLTLEQLASIRRGEKPSSLGEQEDVAWDVAMGLVEGNGPLSEELWERAVRFLGERGAFLLVQYVGFYSYVGVILNGFDVPLPDGVTI